MENNISTNINTDLNQQNEIKNTSQLNSPNSILVPENNEDFLITSITSELTTKNKILETEEDDYNEKIFIIKITGNINFLPISWDIYVSPNQIKDLFLQIEQDLIKKDPNLINPIMSLYITEVKNYSIDLIYDNIEIIIKYIQYLYNDTEARNLPIFNEFLKISAISFYNNNGIKPFEGYAYKKADPRYLRYVIKILFSKIEHAFFKQRNRRWIVLKDDMICYMNDPNKMIGKNVYWFDENSEINKIEENKIKIENLSINLNLKFETKFERDLWYKEINGRIEKKINEIINNPYHSFASQKNNCRAKWFIDGENYFNYLLEQLKQAKEAVHITDWFLSPPVALKRPINYDNFIDGKKDYKKTLTFENCSRLMDILYLLAKKGVHIYILLFYEIKLALPLDSFYAKTTLNNLHPNIKVTRHPKGSTSILWSHHEKLVIIDQQIAFVGGLDLCWGRYDTNKHPIVEEENKDNLYYYPGADYMNERIREMHDVDKFNIPQINRNESPRIGWHDIHTMVTGPIVSDIMRHFVERWNYARTVKRNDQLVRVGVSVHLKPKKDKNNNKLKIEKIYDDNNNINININNDDFNIRPKDKLIDRNKTFEDKKDPNSNSNNDNQEEDKKETNNIVINSKISKINIDNNLKYDNDFKKEDEEDSVFDNDNFDNLNINENNININNNNGHMFTNIKNKIKNKFDDYKNKISKKFERRKSESFIMKQNINLLDENIKDKSILYNFRIQALRSVCNWSIGLSNTERSILEGYYKLIDNSKHYIYIENQFFITKPYSEDERFDSKVSLKKLVKNEIGLHIRNRIERAYEKKENFKVFICIPLLPGFSGVPGESSTLDVVLKYTLQSIGNNKGYSLLELLRQKIGKDLDNYIYFFSLRNHGVINSIPVTELIYIHSKLLIVDDKKVLIGSANINDRSMLGNRDSEFAVIMEEECDYKSIMDNKSYVGSNYAISLRKNLMAEHFNIDINDPILNDPLNDKLWNLMKDKAENNTLIYDKIFDCYPHKKFNNFSALKARRLFKTNEEIEKLKKDYDENIDKIDGHIVEYPYDFLKDEVLDISFFSKENLVPVKNFT